MVSVKVTMSVRGQEVLAENVPDKSVRAALLGMGRDVSTKLANVQCPTHQRGPRDVHVHVGRNGAADIKYDSCCDELGSLVQAALG